MNILIFTDAWLPQTNGVVTCYINTIKELEKKHKVIIISPQDFKYTIPVPSYPEIKIPIDIWSVFKILKDFNPNLIHIATPDATVGLAGKLYCFLKNKKYTTSYHTRLPEYIAERYPIPKFLIYYYERFCHSGSKNILVTTESMKDELKQHGFNSNKMSIWPRGVNLEKYNQKNRVELFKRPVFLYVGRVSVEKNLEKFLNCDIEGTKVIVGDGPQLQQLIRKYPNVIFTGYKFGKELQQLYASSDVFVFPSLTDTFGIVLLEAIASGTPVASYDVTGPKDIIINGVNGYRGSDLKECIEKCLLLDRNIVSKSANIWTWESCTNIFFKESKGENLE
jgi:glycosyltransferase involved in cell wall biosynthesis